MEKEFKILQTTRNNILKLIESLSLEQLNKIPAGFKNNILWNAGHCVVVQGLLCYRLCGRQLPFDAELVEKYKKGTEAVDYTIEDYNTIVELLQKNALKMENDFNEGRLQEYTTYETSYGYTLNDVEDAIQFNTVHEGLHYGYMMALRKLV